MYRYCTTVIGGSNWPIENTLEIFFHWKSTTDIDLTKLSSLVSSKHVWLRLGIIELERMESENRPLTAP
jgi:hypothetical protein